MERGPPKSACSRGSAESDGYRIQISLLPDLLQTKVAEAHEVQQEFRYFLLEPPKPPRKLSVVQDVADDEPAGVLH